MVELNGRALVREKAARAEDMFRHVPLTRNAASKNGDAIFNQVMMEEIKLRNGNPESEKNTTTTELLERGAFCSTNVYSTQTIHTACQPSSD